MSNIPTTPEEAAQKIADDAISFVEGTVRDWLPPGEFAPARKELTQRILAAFAPVLAEKDAEIARLVVLVEQQSKTMSIIKTSECAPTAERAAALADIAERREVCPDEAFFHYMKQLPKPDGTAWTGGDIHAAFLAGFALTVHDVVDKLADIAERREADNMAANDHKERLVQQRNDREEEIARLSAEIAGLRYENQRLWTKYDVLHAECAAALAAALARTRRPDWLGRSY